MHFIDVWIIHLPLAVPINSTGKKNLTLKLTKKKRVQPLTENILLSKDYWQSTSFFFSFPSIRSSKYYSYTFSKLAESRSSNNLLLSFSLALVARTLHWRLPAHTVAWQVISSHCSISNLLYQGSQQYCLPDTARQNYS